MPDISSTQEMSVNYAAGSAEQAFGGVQINLVPREGGNTFKGSFFATGANSSFQGHNLHAGAEGAGADGAQLASTSSVRRQSRHAAGRS